MRVATQRQSSATFLHHSRCYSLVQVVQIRSRSMAAAAAQGEPHGMLSVVGLSDGDLQGLCDAALSQLPPGTVCRIANLMFPQVSHEA